MERKEVGCGNEREERKKSEFNFFFFWAALWAANFWRGMGGLGYAGLWDGRAGLWGRKKFEKKHMKIKTKKKNCKHPCMLSSVSAPAHQD
jgi:hypothetical protein